MFPALSNSDLRILRAVDDRPGTVAWVIAHSANVPEETAENALAFLEREGLVRKTTILRTGAVSWRVTRQGVDQLIRTPPARLRRAGARPAQLELVAR